MSVSCSSALDTIAPISQAPPIILSSVINTSVVTTPIFEMVSGAFKGTLSILAALVIVYDLSLAGALASVLSSEAVL